MAKTPPDLWTIKEAAAYLRISDAWMYQLARVPEKAGGPPICRPVQLPVRANRKKRNGDWKITGRRPLIRIPREQFIAWVLRKDNTSCSA